MNYIKKHKLTSFVILVYIIVIAFLYFIYKLFIGSSGLPVYGDRLDGIENVPITEEQINQISEEITKNDFVLKVTKPYIKGKVLKVIVTVADNSDLAKSKELSSKVIEILDDEQKAFYDVEFFIKKPYNCTIEATGKMDEEGVFLDDVEVKFVDDLSKSEFGIEYGLSTTDSNEFNSNQKITVKEDGEHIIYGITKDKSGNSKCSIKIVKKAENTSVSEVTIDTVTVERDFPTIGYMKAGTNKFSWAKTT